MTSTLHANRIAQLKDRLKESSSWFPVPAIISFTLVLIFTGHLLVNINPRLGSPSEIITLSADVQKEGSIWLSVSTENDEVFVTTYDRKSFSWPSKNVADDGINQFEQYLYNISLRNATHAAIAKGSTKSQTKVIIAVDQRLKYFHIRPIIHSLAKAGIDSYGFETQIELSTASAKSHSDKTKVNL